MLDPEALPIPDFGLRCLNCGYLLAGLPEHRCPECGRLIKIQEHIPPGDWPMVILEGAPVSVTAEVSSMLGIYQIPFMSVRSHSGRGETGIDDVLGLGALGESGKLRVPRLCFFETVDLLRRLRLGEPMPEPPPAPKDLPDWKCESCGEENPGNFDICWKCEHERPAAT
ncbi:MAG TPA: hypothetical protein VMV81_08690 [Phycisphaerae bacterium]|nr:hypothetical protein [Phycisphaerae bacterium]